MEGLDESVYGPLELKYTWSEGSSPYGLDVLPASDTSHCSFLVFGSAMHSQQLGDRWRINKATFLNPFLIAKFTDKYKHSDLFLIV